MKIHVFILAAVISCGLFQACSGNASSKLPHLPAYKIIFDKFYSKYGSPEGEYIEFAKKPAGYYVVEKDAQLKTIKEHLFWSTETKEFKTLPELFKQAHKQGNAPMGEYYSRTYSFDHALYFNYPDAADESIAALEGVSDLTDTLYEKLARAYNIKCDELAGNRQGQGKGPKGKRMSAGDAKQFVAYGKKILEAYTAVKKLNPVYETMVGKINTKLSNEHVYLWLELEQSGFHDLAGEFLPKGLYNGIMIAFAKNILASCPENTILFTHGDNDTFPVLYVQASEHYREDVAVINCSLTNVPEYIAYYKRKYGLETTLSQSDYENELLSYVMLASEDKTVNINEFINALKNPGESELKMQGVGSEFIQFPANKFEWNVTGEHTDEFDQERAKTDKHLFTINRSYIFLSDLFELDVLSTNNWKRPVAYVASGETNISASIKSLMDNYGLVTVVSPFAGGQYMQLSTNKARLENLLMKKYTYNIKYDDGYEPRIVSNYFMNFMTLANEYLASQDFAKATEALNRAEKEIPFMQHPKEMERMIVYYASLRLQAGDRKKAVESLDVALDETEALAKNCKDDSEREDIYGLAGQIKTIALKENFEKQKARAEKIGKSLFPNRDSKFDNYMTVPNSY